MKANKKAQTQKQAQKQDPETPEYDPKLPLPKTADELTLQHIPQKLRDEIRRPVIQAGHTIWALFQQLQDSRNDMINGLAQLGKSSAKDSERLNQSNHLGGLGPALETLGLAKKKE